MKASRVMTKDVTCITPDFGLERSWSLMKKLNVRHLPVVFSGRLVGIVSDRDLLLRALVLEGGAISFPPLAVGEAMTPHPITCQPATPVSRLAALMLEHRIDSIPIVSLKDELIGLVTSTDLIELLTEPDTVTDVLPFEFNVKPADDQAAA
ncbi:MAG: CBS domain-containing protein [Myxococcaceae bacterium]|nr:CBS domain-containing protein [Myxococcaceae bacterium]